MRFFCTIILISIIFTKFAFAEKITSIEVNGNKRISKDSIILFSEINVGTSYTEKLINSSIKKLYDTNFFNNIDISFNNSKLIITVDENPIIEQIDIVGVKNKNFLKFIRENISSRERASFTDFTLKKDLQEIDNILKTNGYYFSKINVSYDTNVQSNTLKLLFNIDLGKKAKIGDISFIGNKIFKEKKLIEILVSEENKFWKFISKNVYLNERLINLDRRLLEKFYKDRGYYNVKIVDNYVELNNKTSTFNLIYNIDAGKKYYINNFSLTLPDDYIKQDFQNIFRDFEKNKGSIYSLRFIEKILDEIEKIASTKSYDFIDVNVNESFSDTNKIDFNFVVSDSEKFYVENIDISGNYITFEEVIRNQLIVDEGDPLNNLLFNKSINEIRSLGFFKDVNFKISDGSDSNLKKIDIILEEQPTGEISIAAGVGTTGFQSGGQISEKNFLGKGIKLNSDIQFSEDSIKGQIFYSKPNFAYSDYTLTTAFRTLSNDFISLYGYETKEIGASIGTSYEQFENIYFSPELDLKFEDLIANNQASRNIKNQEGKYSDLYFNYGLTQDLRD